jgi:hypothetical protein
MYDRIFRNTVTPQFRSSPFSNMISPFTASSLHWFSRGEQMMIYANESGGSLKEKRGNGGVRSDR